MGKLLLALTYAVTMVLCGCAVNGVSVNQAPAEQEPMEEETLELDGLGDELDNTDVSTMEEPVNPSGKTEVGCMVVGLPYEVGPMKFNCPSEYVVLEKTDDSIELYAIDGGMVKAEVTYGKRNYPSADQADLAKQTIEDTIHKSCPNGSEMRWFEYNPDYITASYIGDQVFDDHTNKVVGDYIYSSDYVASLTIVVPSEDFPSCEYTVLEIADTLRINPSN